MKRLARFGRGIVRLTMWTVALSAAVVVLDAVLSPDGVERG
jgi:hypothetical protein